MHPHQNLPPHNTHTHTATPTPTPPSLAASLPALADPRAHKCDGDRVTVAWGGGGGRGGGGRHHATSAVDPPALVTAAASAFGGGSTAGVNKTSCYGEFSTHWDADGKSGCFSCTGTFSLLTAPCGARVATCDGRLKHYGRASHPGGGTAWHGTGALGVSVMVAAPRSHPHHKQQEGQEEEGGDDAGADRRRRANGEPAWHTAVRFSSDGVWGEGWALKQGGGGDGGDDDASSTPPSGPAFEAAARTALGGAPLPGDAGWVAPGEGGFVRRAVRATRRAVSALASAAAPAAPASGSAGPTVTCNGEAVSHPLIKVCVGKLVVKNHPTGGHGHLDGACYGLWTGGLHVCQGLATSHLSPSEETAEGEGEEADGGCDPALGGGCPARWSLRRQCDGKAGAHPKAGGVGVWCAGRTSGALLVQEEQGGGGGGGGGHGRHRHRHHQAEVVVD